MDRLPRWTVTKTLGRSPAFQAGTPRCVLEKNCAPSCVSQEGFFVPLMRFVNASRLEAGAPAQCGEATSIVRHELTLENNFAPSWLSQEGFFVPLMRFVNACGEASFNELQRASTSFNGLQRASAGFSGLQRGVVPDSSTAPCAARWPGARRALAGAVCREGKARSATSVAVGCGRLPSSPSGAPRRVHVR